MSVSTASPRSRLACRHCIRRKVKCSKTIPCSNCVRRGEQETCGLDNEPTQEAGLLPSAQAKASGEFRDEAFTERELHSLKRKVSALEAELRKGVGGLRYLPSSPSVRDGSVLTKEEIHVQPVIDVANAGGYSPEETGDAVIENAASILEFLAWGRRKDPDYHTTLSPEATVSVLASGDVRDARSRENLADGLDENSTAVLQLLLPSRRQVWQLIEYHQECLLWYHCSFHGPTFRNQLQAFYEQHDGDIDSSGVNLQWVALLFAVLASTLTCTTTANANAWGFKEPERGVLSKRWFKAVITCLHRAEYSANHSILATQAITTLTMSAHLLGFSNMHSIFLATAIRIAQALGLHKLTEDAPGHPIEKETGRRVWAQLCSQDWFSIPFSESYLIHPLYSQSAPPLNCHDDAMTALPDDVPTATGYCRYLLSIARIMPQLQDGLMSCNTAYTKYEQVLHWDKQLRALATAQRPSFLTNIPIDLSWPIHVLWARRSLAISSSHKIIMIHRSFLSESFSNPAFGFTRRTCLAASKTILKEFKASHEEEGTPTLWVHQAFSVAACIILVLDALHRLPNEREFLENKTFVEDTVPILQQYSSSMIALRGVKLLSALLNEVYAMEAGRETADANEMSNNKKRRQEVMDEGRPATKRSRGFDVPAFVKSFCAENSTSVADRHQARHETAFEASPWPSMTPVQELLADAEQEGFIYPPPGLENATSFENLLYLANYDFPSF